MTTWASALCLQLPKDTFRTSYPCHEEQVPERLPGSPEMSASLKRQRIAYLFVLGGVWGQGKGTLSSSISGKANSASS